MERLQNMSKASMKRAQDYYGVDRLAGQFNVLYRELLA
jgi:hypothetical protein